mmetsp:Transcript_26366/g.64260  ORF Transcript_26366/g.64260 Transcript_26366/m.64260 type:complete len:329 (+) Transcript_26366:827-1813(+)
MSCWLPFEMEPCARIRSRDCFVGPSFRNAFELPLSIKSCQTPTTAKRDRTTRTMAMTTTTIRKTRRRIMRNTMMKKVIHPVLHRSIPVKKIRLKYCASFKVKLILSPLMPLKAVDPSQVVIWPTECTVVNILCCKRIPTLNLPISGTKISLLNGNRRRMKWESCPCTQIMPFLSIQRLEVGLLDAVPLCARLVLRILRNLECICGMTKNRARHLPLKIDGCSCRPIGALGLALPGVILPLISHMTSTCRTFSKERRATLESERLHMVTICMLLVGRLFIIITLPRMMWNESNTIKRRGIKYHCDFGSCLRTIPKLPFKPCNGSIRLLN